MYFSVPLPPAPTKSCPSPAKTMAYFVPLPSAHIFDVLSRSHPQNPQWTFTRDGNSLLQSEPKKSTFISFYLHFYFTGVLRVVSFSCSHWGPGVQASILQRELRRIKSAFLQRGGRTLLWPLLSPKLGGFRSRPPQEEPLMVS